jgi:hypothetical protein
MDGDELWTRVLRPAGARLAARADELADSFLARNRTEVPELYPDADAVEAARASMAASIRGFAEAMAYGSAVEPQRLQPETAAYINYVARRDLPLEGLMRTYRIANAALLDASLAELAEHTADASELLEATRIYAERLFAFLDQAHTVRERLYARERYRFERSASALRADAIAAILERHEADPVAAGVRLGYPLGREHVGVCAWSENPAPDADTLARLEGAIGDLADVLGTSEPLIHPLGLLAVAGWLGADRIDNERLSTLAGALEPTSGVRISIGEIGAGLAGFRSTHLEALGARRVATLTGAADGSVTRYCDVALEALASEDLSEARAFVTHELGRLLGDDEAAARIRETLHVYLDENGNRSQTARRLGVHENTISNRIRRAEQLRGRSLEEGTLTLHLALALVPLLGGQASAVTASVAQASDSR